MILRAFASNQPYTLIAVPLVIVGALLPAAWHAGLPIVQADFPADELFAWVYTSRMAVVLSAVVLLLGGAFLSNGIFNRHEFFNVPVYVPAIVYAMVGSAFCLIQTSLPALIANIFVLAGLNRQLRIFRQTRVLAEYFECGFWYGMAAIFYPPFLALLAGMWLTTFITRAFNWREHLLPVVAFSVPFLYWIVWKYWSDDLGNLILFRKIFTYDAQNMISLMSWSQKAFVLLCGLSILMALPRYLFLADRASNKARSVKTVFIIMAVAICVALLLGYVLLMKWILLCMLLPVVYIAGYWFTNYRFSLIAPLIFYVVCTAATIVALHFYGIISW